MKRTILLLSILFVVLTSCVKNLDDSTNPEALRTIKLDNDTLTVHVNDVQQIDLTLTPSTYNRSLLLWESSDTTVISIANTGAISAKKIGTSIISISNPNKTVSVSCLIKVIAASTIPGPDSLKTGLIAYYPFNYNSAVDSSGNGNDGTIFDISSVPDRFGKINSAYYFNGATSYIRINDNQDLRLNNTDFTINVWVNLDEYIGYTGSAVLSKNNGPYQNGWNCSITGYGSANTVVGKVGRAFYNVSGGDDPFAVGDKVININQWYMITVLYNKQKQEIQFYVNGVLDNVVSNIPTPNAATNTDLFIGKNSYNDSSGQTPGYFIKGKLDDIRIYNRKLSLNNIHTLYTLPY